jgi:cytosine/adenosine deaminase-related metal-dependent hydrolase
LSDNYWISYKVSMSAQLVYYAKLLVAVDDHRREIPDDGLFVRHGSNEQVRNIGRRPSSAHEVLDQEDHPLLPGLVG